MSFTPIVSWDSKHNRNQEGHIQQQGAGIEAAARARMRDAVVGVERPLVCPRCERAFHGLNSCPDCNELLVDEEFVDLVRPQAQRRRLMKHSTLVRLSMLALITAIAAGCFLLVPHL